jgi:hypothetical protein
MNLDIGAKKPIDGDQVFLVARFLTSAEPPFVLLYDPAKKRRAKRNIQKMDPLKVIASIGNGDFIEVEYPRWGTVWFRASRVRGVRELLANELLHSPESSGSLVLFQHDPKPADEHAGFLLFGMEAAEVAQFLNQEVESR